MISSPACRSGFPPYCLHVLVALLAALTSAPGAEPAAPKTALPVVNRPTNIVSLFDGKTLAGWKVTDFAGTGEVRIKDAFRGGPGAIILEQGVMTGITWTNDLPRMNYEITWEAMRVEGSDFFSALTFPVGNDPCSLIVGGWGGGVVGLSSLDGEDAAHNETTKFMNFEKGRWYALRLRVSGASIQAWLDGESMVNIVTTDRALSIRAEVEPSKPLGFATWSTTGALRNIQLRRLPAEENKPAAK